MKSADLQVGEVYFMVGFADPDLYLPHLTPVVFVGHDLQAEDTGHVYFQDIDSYVTGVHVTDIANDEKSDEELGHCKDSPRTHQQSLNLREPWTNYFGVRCVAATPADAESSAYFFFFLNNPSINDFARRFISFCSARDAAAAISGVTTGSPIVPVMRAGTMTRPSSCA